MKENTVLGLSASRLAEVSKEGLARIERDQDAAVAAYIQEAADNGHTEVEWPPLECYQDGCSRQGKPLSLRLFSALKSRGFEVREVRHLFGLFRSHHVISWSNPPLP